MKHRTKEPPKPLESELKLIDEWIIELKGSSGILAALEPENCVARDALARLREAWANGEMPLNTPSLANYFEEEITDGIAYRF